MNKITNEIKVISQAEAKNLLLANAIGTFGWNAGSLGTYAKTQKQAVAWVRKVMQGNAYRVYNIGYVWQNVYDNQDGKGTVAQPEWGANFC